MGERERWERRYLQADEPFHGGVASQFLQSSLSLLPKCGTCLDLAGGEGRNAIFLASMGYEVTLADLAVSGLARARTLAREAGVSVRIVAADLDLSPLVDPEHGWDMILLMNYHDRRVVASAAGHLRVGGTLVVQGFAREHFGLGRGGPRDPDVLWGTNELVELLLPLRIVWYEDRLVDKQDEPHHGGVKWVVRAVARRVG